MIDNTKLTWRNIWLRHYSSYVRAIPRQAYYLFFVLRNEDQRILEIGAGSFRDTVRLNEWGYNCIGIDFLRDVVEFAKKRYPTYKDKMLPGDASRLSFTNKCFDVSFHNGFYILFQQDELIHSLLREQVRVTKRCIVCTVHNKLNTRLVNLFREKSGLDPLYDVRFFYPNEMKNLLKPYCDHVAILPFGTPILDRLIRYMAWYPKGLKWLYSKTSSKMKLENCERIMAVGFLS
ncbi:MAG: class I SAM-dependent methyltransferase [Thermodesulfobacteriota bacterium]